MVAVRAPFSALGGALLCAALFLGLWQLVNVPMVVPERTAIFRLDYTRQRPDTPVETRPREKPRPPKEIDVIEPSGPGGTSDPITIVRPEPTTIVRPQKNGMALGVDRDSVPVVRIDPDYPPRAEHNGIEGWVQVRFTVTAAGTVRDAVIVASEPGEVFDDAALEAIARWRYNPRVESGMAVERVGLQTLFRFEVEN